MSQVNREIICPVVNRICIVCPQVQREWDLDGLFSKMKIVKALLSDADYQSIDDVPAEEMIKAEREPRELTLKEKCWLCLLLDGDYNVKHIEKYLVLSNIGPDLSKTIYKWVSFMSRKKVSDWSHVRNHLEKLGYRIGLMIIDRAYKDKIPEVIEILKIKFGIEVINL